MYYLNKAIIDCEDALSMCRETGEAYFCDEFDGLEILENILSQLRRLQEIEDTGVVKQISYVLTER